MRDEWPLYIGNRPRQPNTDLAVTDKYTGAVIARVAQASPEHLDEAMASADRARQAMRELPPYTRREILAHCARRFEERAEELAQVLCVEAGKPIGDARGEVSRLVDTFRVASEEATRLHGEVLEMRISARARAYRGMTRRLPVGPCAFISPFNFPLNLVAHKVAPAIAAGCPFVLKPASRTPLGALIVAEVLAETDLPPGAFSVVPASRDVADALVTDPRMKLLSFTGSPAVGWDLKSRAGKKRVILELGGNAAVIVHEDADIDDAVQRILTGTFYQSGQSCISVQRILAHVHIYDELRDKLVEAASALEMGDPSQESTRLGPLISEREARRVCSWVDVAVNRGARLLCGGGRQGAFVEATLLEDAPLDCAVVAQEVFGPVAVLYRYLEFDDALRAANASRYGLQAGVFTRDLYRAMKAWDELEVGGVVVGDIPSWRVDHMPYGGVKDSGLGREGIRYAMEDMTEPRLLILRDPEAD